MVQATPAPVLKIHRRLLPLFVSLVVVSYLDRTSLAFAALQLCQQPWFNAKVYGLGSGVFYLGYVLFQVPSNLVLSKLGARIWLPLITAAWGVVATCCIFISGPASFYALRLALGITESGAFPAMWYTCGQFYPSSHITVAYSVMEASVAISQIISAPVAAALLHLSGVGGLAGWQHLFLAEGLATLVMAGVLRWRLPGSVLTADFLTPEDKMWLLQQLEPTAAGAADAVVVVAEESIGSGRTYSAADAVGSSAQEDCSSKGSNVLQQQQHDEEQQQLLLPAAAAAAAGHGGSSGSSKQQPEQQQHPQGKDQGLGLQQQAAGMLPALAQPQQQQQQEQQHKEQQHKEPQQQSQKMQPPVSLSSREKVLLTMKNKWILYLALLKAMKDIVLDGLIYWLPMLVHALIDGSASLGLHPTSSSGSRGGGSSDTKHCGGKDSQLTAVLLSAVPFGTAAVAAMLLGHTSEVTGERHRHIGVPLLLGGCVFASLPWLLQLPSHVPAFLAVTAAVVAADSTTGPFWTWVHLVAAPGTEAVSLAAVNSMGKAGGFLGPLGFGLVLHATGSYVPSILLVAAIQVLSGVLALCYRGERPLSIRAYSKLQEVEQVLVTPHTASPPPPAAAAAPGLDDAWQRQQQQRHKQRALTPPERREVELLRGSSGDSVSR